MATAIGLLGLAQPLRAQVLVPHTTEIDPEQLEYIGLELLQDADRWARFQQFAEAIPRAELASQLLPENAQVWAILGSLYVQTDRFDEGLSALLRARQIEPENAAIRFALGSAYFQGGDYAGTIAELHAGLELMPNTPGALFDLGNAYFVTNQFELAIANYEDAFAQNAEFWPALNNIGLVHYEQGHVDRAIAQWETSTTIAPQEAEPLLARAAALYAQGEREVGLTLAEEALRLDVRYADLEFLKENLWGEQLLKAAEQLLATPRLQAVIAQSSQSEPIFIRP
ncbi:MAG: tetratricopeptide repeat protein [Oscillatoriales cyanobacterium]|nr:MAG: tetratricopeptide repeat protein [Oscillatoriales cyanobacterium]